jgi:hypothetical protein
MLRCRESNNATPFSTGTTHATCPGRSAARSDACRPGIVTDSHICEGPGSAVHRHSASKTRVNALMALHRVRDTARTASFSRRVRARALPTTTTPRKESPRHTHDPEKWCPAFGHDHAQKREAKRRKAHANHIRAAATDVATQAALSAAARHCRGRARLPALHRGTRHRLSPRWLSPRTGFPQSAAHRSFARSPHNALS